VVTHYLIEAADALLPRPYPIELIIERGLYFGLVWLLWYAVSIELAGDGQSVLTPKVGARRAADVLAVSFGAMLVFIGYLVRGQFGGADTYSSLIALPYLVWGAAILAFYGRDLWLCRKMQSTKQNDTLPDPGRPA
jgi:hypothetical protein